MRAACKIISDIKDGKEVPYDELKMACLEIGRASCRERV